MSLKALKKGAEKQAPESAEAQVALAEERQANAKLAQELAEARKEKQQSDAAYLLSQTKGAIKDAAIKYAAINPDETATLLMGLEGSKIVHSEQGFKLGDKPIDEAVSEFLKTRPHLKQATPVSQGTGQSAGMVPTSLNASTKQNAKIDMGKVASSEDFANAVNEAMRNFSGIS